MKETECPVCKELYCGNGKEPCVDCEAIIKKIGCPSCQRLRDLCGDLLTYIKPQPDDRHFLGHWNLLEQRLKDEGIG